MKLSIREVKSPAQDSTLPNCLTHGTTTKSKSKD